MKRLVSFFVAALLSVAAISANAEFLDHFTQVKDLTSAMYGGSGMTSAVCLEDRIVAISGGRTYLEYLRGPNNEPQRQDLPAELSTAKDLDYDGTYIYTVTEYGDRSRVYRWLPGAINDFEMVTEEGTYFEGIAVDPDTKDIYLSCRQPYFVEKVKKMPEDHPREYAGSYLCVVSEGRPVALAWLPNGPEGRNLVAVYESDEDGDGNDGTGVVFIDPEHVDSRTEGVELVAGEADNLGKALGATISTTINPGVYSLITTSFAKSVDAWELTPQVGNGRLIVNAQNQLTHETIEGAAVEVKNAEGVVEASGVTNAEGKFIVDEIPIGVKRICVEIEGMSPYIDEECDVLRNQDNTVYAHLLPFGGGYELAGVSSSDYMYINTSGTELEFASDDDGVCEYQLATPISFYGVEYSTIYVGINGVVTFSADTPVPNENSAIPTADAPNNFVAALWMDLHNTESEDYSVKVYDNTSESTFAIQWTLLDSEDQAYQFEAQFLYGEGSRDAIKVIYRILPGDSAPAGVIAGVENADGTSGLDCSYCVREDGGFSLFWIENDVEESAVVALPSVYSLSNAFPNPFNPTTCATVQLAKPSNLRVVVFNTLGRQVAVVAEGSFSAGAHQFVIDGSQLSSGTYFVNATIPGVFSQTRRITLVK